MSARPAAGHGFMRSRSGAVGVMQRIFDAFWIFCVHYGSYLLYPYITRGLARFGFGAVVNNISQEWTTSDTLASVTAIVTFQVVAEAQGLAATVTNGRGFGLVELDHEPTEGVQRGLRHDARVGEHRGS